MGSGDRVGRFGPLESVVLEVLWDASEPLPVRRVLEVLNRDREQALAYTTVMTVLSRLAERGVVARSKVGRGYVYRPVARDEAGIAVRRLLDDYGEAALVSFVDQVGDDEALAERLRKLVDGS
ncbi:BlaI/MecI/CopY family transcriptional regulator [Glycomyces tenuis]|uniref:BlaI/MecI/CopY family transcriptional regulator n=1 Tax=Glycomyces tenuis TaxID=58116 RepID=UPI0003F4D8C2|nr:BlaI/MecI/CopY family transcriptional regulator [Glycomyces tenuis]